MLTRRLLSWPLCVHNIQLHILNFEFKIAFGFEFAVLFVVLIYYCISNTCQFTKWFSVLLWMHLMKIMKTMQCARQYCVASGQLICWYLIGMCEARPVQANRLNDWRPLHCLHGWDRFNLSIILLRQYTLFTDLVLNMASFIPIRIIINLRFEQGIVAVDVRLCKLETTSRFSGGFGLLKCFRFHATTRPMEMIRDFQQKPFNAAFCYDQIGISCNENGNQSTSCMCVSEFQLIAWLLFESYTLHGYHGNHNKTQILARFIASTKYGSQRQKNTSERNSFV